jgi:hypothetical protein
VIGVLVVFLLLMVAERPNLVGWPRRERLAFWVTWAAVLAWALAVQRHMHVPTFPDLTNWLFKGLARRLMVPRPDIYW